MIVDFQSKFKEYIEAYKSRRELDDEAIEAVVPDLYLKWLEEPKSWLGDMSPNIYFASMDAAQLIESLGKYIIAGIALPGALLNRIADTKSQTYPYLINLLKNYEGEKSEDVKIEIISLIEEMDFARPYEYYLEIIINSTDKNDLAEACAEELKGSADAVIGQIITALELTENAYVSDCLLDVLCELPHDDRTFQLVLEKLLYSDTNRAFYASCLGKLGDERALPFLEEALKSEDTDFYDYTAMKNALEELGGEIDIERDFSGDKDYDSLIDMGE